MVGRYRALILIVVMLLSGASFASAEEAPVDSPPVEDDVQSRGIIGAPTQLPLSVQFAFRVYGSGRLDGLIGKEAFSCPPRAFLSFPEHFTVRI